MSGLIPYILSSLPLPKLGEKLMLDSVGFLDTCHAHLAPAEFATLAAAGLHPEPAAPATGDDAPTLLACETLRRWREFETYLRNRIADKRANALKIEAAPYRRDEADVFPGWKRSIDEALAAATPLAREKALDKLRWQRLDDLVPGHEMDFDALANYRLRLLLAEKEAAWQPETGTANLDAWLNAATDGADAKRTGNDE